MAFPAQRKQSFYAVLTTAVRDLAEYGYDSPERLERWLRALETAARGVLAPEAQLRQHLHRTLEAMFSRLTSENALLRAHKGVSRFTLLNVKPKLRAELNRRILASADLIGLNRQASIQRALQRFAGWATSIPVGGTMAADKQEAAANVRRSIAGLPFIERRVIIDQGHKLAASVSEIVATDAGAIAGVWHSHWRETGYNYREDHKERDGHLFLVRDSWALERKLVRLQGHQYYDQVTAVGQEVFCRCYMTWIYNLRDLPADLLTVAGRDELQRVRSQIKRLS